MLRNLWNDENGFIVSAELVLIATLLVIGMIVGLSEVQHAVVEELGDVGEAIGSLNQSYSFNGFSSAKAGASQGTLKSFTQGSFFTDSRDDCDGNECQLACAAPAKESATKVAQ